MTDQPAINVETLEHGSVRRELRIEVGADRVSEAMTQVIGEIAGTARISGFRKGKVPRELISKRFKREIEGRVLEMLAGPAVAFALEKTNLVPLHRPVITEVVLHEAQPLTFTASFEIVPEIEPKDYRGVVLKVSARSIGEEDIDAELTAIRDRAATFEAVESRPLRPGDYALAELRTTIDGEERTQADALIEVGGDDFHPDFTANLVGMEPGTDRSFKVTYGADDQDPRAAGKEVSYAVRLREVKRKEAAEIDDAFAEDVSEFQTLAEFRVHLKGQLETRLEQALRGHQENLLAEALVPTVTVDVPNALVESEVERLLEDHVRALVHRGIDPRTAPIDWKLVRQRLREQAEGIVKWQLLLDAIARKERVAVSDGDLDTAIAGIAQQSERSVDFVRSKIAEDGRIEELRRSVRRRKTVDFLIENAKMERR